MDGLTKQQATFDEYLDNTSINTSVYSGSAASVLGVLGNKHISRAFGGIVGGVSRTVAEAYVNGNIGGGIAMLQAVFEKMIPLLY